MFRLISSRAAVSCLLVAFVGGFGALRLAPAQRAGGAAAKTSERPTNPMPAASAPPTDIPSVTVGTICHTECEADGTGAFLLCKYTLTNNHHTMVLNVRDVAEELCRCDYNCDGDCDDGTSRPIDVNVDGDFCDEGDVPPVEPVYAGRCSLTVLPLELPGCEGPVPAPGCPEACGNNGSQLLFNVGGVCDVQCELTPGLTREFLLRIKLNDSDEPRTSAQPSANMERNDVQGAFFEVSFSSAEAWCGRNVCCQSNSECTGGRNVCSTCEPLCVGPFCSSFGCCEETTTCSAGVICCALGASCDDANVCTTDTCASGCCVNTPECVSDDDPVCDDGKACTVDSCSVFGCCVHEDLCPAGVVCCADGASCDTDGSACTVDTCGANGCCELSVDLCPGGDVCCADAQCEPGQPCSLCDDGDPSTVDPCSDNRCCQNNPICADGIEYCGLGSLPFPCSDDDPCTDDHCDGTCCAASTPHCPPGVTCCADGTSCDDGDPCTDDVCTDGCCVHTQHCPGGDCGTSLVCPPGVCCRDGITCNDDDPCTDDSCGVDGCCAVVPHCPQGVLCCAGGADCDVDGLACTDDTCGADGCCEQNPHCPTGVTCCADDPTCVPGGICTSCDDGDPCTDDACGVDGCCEHTPHCPGGDCNGETICPPGVCCLDETVCNDDDPCTDDTCGPEGCCVVGPHCPDVTGCCVDDEFCRTRGVCAEPECCAEDEECAYDACLVSSCVGGCCTYEPYCPDGANCCLDGASCDDGDPCTLDSCGTDGCCEHEPRCPDECCLDDGVCDDGDPCTDDLCNQHTGCCKHVLHCLDGAEDCPDDFDACTFPMCTPEGCCDTRPRCPDGVSCCANDGLCDDGNPCTREKCMPTGCCKPVPACVDPVRDCTDDGDPCTIAFCTEDGCCDTRLRLCPQDFNLCTEEVCDSATGLCISQPIVPVPAGCP